MLNRHNNGHVQQTDGRRGLTFWAHWTTAISTVLALLVVLTLRRTGEFDDYYRMLAVITVLGSIPLYALVRAYEKSLGYFDGLARVMLAWFMLLGLLAAIAFITKTSHQYSRQVLLQWLVLGTMLQAVSFALLHNLSRRYEAVQLKKRKAIIVGVNKNALQLADKLIHEWQEPLCGLVATESHPSRENRTTNHEHGEQKVSQSPHPILGEVIQLRALIKQHGATIVYIALPLADADQIEGLYIDLLDTNVEVIWVPGADNIVLLNYATSNQSGLPTIHLNKSPLTAYPSALLIKGLLDRVLALLALIVLSPLVVGVAIAIKLNSKGPVIFKQQRHGTNNEIIEIWKFRSMRVHEDKQVEQACQGDQRITSVGRFIRRTSIDEIPQFFNVLQGSMSLVGPRPHAVAHNDYYSDKINAYMARHRIKPGITGLAQVSGYRGETEVIESMQKRVELDLAYINQWSMWLDIKILLKTPFSLILNDTY
ncbi:MAG: undecaprenyl-phosphate glucose phosphotransferase [Gammaproteobacteria bacterium]|nr:MAG: undecaprenyl-phosphate glucose phosphotransferase [Gammaproteobacteria bacterium]RLA54974.1 MAG: undecaprenyl-phosphate glucose phosphotransferase [Gammaproteobacteria bacterium]